MFSLLSLWIVFEFTNRTYGPRIGLFASVLLSVMPGFFWISRIAILETALIFFFSLALFFFFSWMRLSQNRDLVFCGLVLGVGFLAKYQILIAGLVMIMAILFLSRKKLRLRFYKFLVVPLIAVLVVVPWVFVLYQNNGLEKLTDLLYVVQEGGQDRAVYSSRFPIPIFYLIEVTWPFTDIPVHPISLPLYILGLCGLLLGIHRRRTEDKFFIIWFLVVYIFFTLIPNKQWRYVTPLFPVLAISAANFIYFIYGKIGATWSDAQASSSNHRVKQIAAALTTLLLASAIFFSGYEAYQMTARDQIHVPFEETTNYLASHMSLNQSAVLVCATNIVSQDMFRFYLPANMSKYQIWQYPALAVDAFTPNFDITEFVDLCQQRNVKYIILFDYGPYMPFFNTTLDYTQVKTMIYNTGRFDDPLDRPFFGEFFNNKGYRLFLVRFNG